MLQHDAVNFIMIFNCFRVYFNKKNRDERGNPIWEVITDKDGNQVYGRAGLQHVPKAKAMPPRTSTSRRGPTLRPGGLMRRYVLGIGEPAPPWWEGDDTRTVPPPTRRARPPASAQQPRRERGLQQPSLEHRPGLEPDLERARARADYWCNQVFALMDERDG